MTLEDAAETVHDLHGEAGEEIDVLLYEIDKVDDPEANRERARRARLLLEDVTDGLEQIERGGPYSLEELHDGPELEKPDDSTETGGNADQ